MDKWLSGLIWALILVHGLGSLPALMHAEEGTSRRTYFSLFMAILGGLLAAGIATGFWLQPMKTDQSVDLLQNMIRSVPAEILDDPDTAINEYEFFLHPTFYADHLAAFFLALTGLFAVGLSTYSAGWLKEVGDRQRIAAIFNIFVLCTELAILANNVYFWLLFLEGMTLSFAYLALYRHNLYLETADSAIGAAPSPGEWEASKTAFKAYLIFSHVGIMFLAAGLVILGTTVHCFDFSAFRSLNEIDLKIGNIVFLLSLAGLGIKAGMTPAHVWVPLVHPYSPTSIHAMMSGVALKVAGIYGMYRIFFEFLQPVQWWWGFLILLLGGLTAVVGVFYALAGVDLKKALASHSVENIGIILVGLGLALIYTGLADQAESPQQRINFSSLAGLALIASLYHLLNHSIFKGLLFLCTGAIESLTGTVALERLGGLARRYRWTAAAFLVGCVSIAGFPPFNGFISEWLTLQAIFAGVAVITTPYRFPLLIGLVLALVMLGAAFGLTALAFVKIAGEVLLGSPRSKQVAAGAKPKDVPWHMRGVMLVAATLCLLLGLLPGVVAPRLGRIAEDLGLERSFVKRQLIGLEVGGAPEIVGQEQIVVSGDQPYQARVSARFLGLLAIVVIGPVVWGIWQEKRIHQQKAAGEAGMFALQAQEGPAWTCGSPAALEHMQPTGSALYALIWQPFATESETLATRMTEQQEKPLPGAVFDEDVELDPSRLELSEKHYVREVFLWVILRAVRTLQRLAQTFGDWFQPGDIRRYLTYIFITFILALAWLFIWLQQPPKGF
jgi:hydrogenase-4 component B